MGLVVILGEDAIICDRGVSSCEWILNHGVVDTFVVPEAKYQNRLDGEERQSPNHLGYARVQNKSLLTKQENRAKKPAMG